MYVWFIGLNHSKYRFLFHAVYIGIMNAIRKSTFHAARYNWVKYLGSDVRSRPLQSVPRVCFGAVCPRPEKGLQKRVNLMQQKTNSDLSRHYLPRQLRHLILQEYLSGVKTARQLSEEHGIPMSTIHKMGQRWKAKNSCSFVSTPNPYPIMSRVTSEEASELLSENKALRRRLEEALLRLEGYEIMGDILQEEYGIDLLKKSAAGQSSVSKKDTQQ